MDKQKLRSRLLLLLKISVSLILILYILWIVDWQRAISVIHHADLKRILLSPGFWLLGFVPAAARWRMVLKYNQVDFSLKDGYFGYLIGVFYSNFLPGVIGGDAVRIGYCIQKTKCDGGTAAASVIIERAMGLVITILFFLGAVAAFPVVIPFDITIPTPWAFITVLVVILVVITGYLLYKYSGDLSRHSSRLVRWIANLMTSGMDTFRQIPVSGWLSILLLSGLFQGANILGTHSFSLGIGLDVPLSVFFAVIPLVYLSTILPISLGGLGVRESVLVFLLGLYGIETTNAITLSFLVYLNQVFLGLIGGLIQLIKSMKRKDEPYHKRRGHTNGSI